MRLDRFDSVELADRVNSRILHILRHNRRTAATVAAARRDVQVAVATRVDVAWRACHRLEATTNFARGEWATPARGSSRPNPSIRRPAPRPTGNQRPSSARARCWRDTGPSRPGPGTPRGRQVPAFRRIWRTSTVLSDLGLGANLHQTRDGPPAERKAAIEA